MNFKLLCAIITLIEGVYMNFNTNSIFYRKGKKLLEDYVQSGGKIEDLSTKDKEYKYIKNAKVFDENGNKVELEKRFELLGYPRTIKKSKTVREDLILEIKEYLKKGGSFHINRKTLPFYERLATYSNSLRRKGVYLTHEQIMKDDLGFKEYSEDYYRCKDIFKIKEFRDDEGFVDSFRLDRKFAAYVKDLAITYEVPHDFIIVILCDEKLKKYNIAIDKVRYIERSLKNYATLYGTFVGLRRNDPVLFESFEYLTRYYSDGSEQTFSKKEWLDIFGLGDVENRFKDVNKQEVIDIDDVMLKLKNLHPDGFIVAKDIDSRDYRKIIKKAVKMGVSVGEVFNTYDLKCKGARISRLTRAYVKEYPYLQEIKERRDKLILQSGKTKENGCCKEEILEARVKAMQQVYLEFKEKLENYLPEDISLENSENLNAENTVTV